MRTNCAFMILLSAGILAILAAAFLVKPPLGPGLACSGGMMLVVIASVGLWRRRSGAAWRWFWVGAALWLMAVVVKFGVSVPTAEPFFKWLVTLPRWAFLTIGTVHGGLMTGLTEILLVLIAAMIWRRMAADAARGVAIGVGAGAFECAILAGVGVFQALSTPDTAPADASLASRLIFLAPVVERLIAVLCHTASRTLVLLAVVRRQWVLFFCGFLLLSGVDAMASYQLLTGRKATMSLWTVDALLLPFGVVSIPITIWCIRRWRDTPGTRVGSASGVVLAPALAPAVDQ